MHQQQTPEVLTTFLTAFEWEVTEAYTRTQDSEGRILFQTGGWLVNLVLAAAAGDRAALQQGDILASFYEALPQLRVSPQARPEVEALRDLLAHPDLTDDDLAVILKRVKVLQQRLLSY